MNRQTGFSLIELTVVLLLITLLTSVAIRETSELGFQTRYEQTKERLEMIQQAILGNPKLIINGQQAVSGFVADMGRLPDAVRELLQMGFCVTAGASNPPAVGEIVTAARRPQDCSGTNVWRWTNLPCTDGVATSPAACTGGHVWLAKQPDTTLNSGLSYGWNGPYLSISGNPADSDALTDGWGRLAQGYCSLVAYTNSTDCTTAGGGWTAAANDFNFGWYFDTLTYLDGIFLQSYGKDQVNGGGNYDKDYPDSMNQPVIKPPDWRINISGGISVNFVKQFGSNNFCGFDSTGSYSPATNCENAGGSWTAGSCTLNQNSCASVGGRWNDCFFSPTTCSGAGGQFRMQCRFTQKACDAAGGAYSWDTVSTSTTYRTCLVLADSAKCGNAGGTWNGSSCDFNEASCSLAGGAWTSECQFSSTTCPTGTTGVAWDTSVKPDSCTFAYAACSTLNGISLDQNNHNYCYLTHAEAAGAKFDVNSCLAASGGWEKRVCMNIFYREASTMNIVTARSTPISIYENGAFSTQLFNGFQDSSGNNVTWVPIGQNAIGIYEYTDNDADGIFCEPGSDRPYPIDRQNPIQVDFHAHATLPVINW